MRIPFIATLTRRIGNKRECEKVAIIMSSKECIISMLARGMLREIVLSEHVCGISLILHDVRLSSAYRWLESESLNLEVQAERSHSKKIIEKKKIIDNIIKLLSMYGKPVRPELHIYVCDKVHVHELVEKAALYGCNASTKCIQNFSFSRNAVSATLSSRISVPRILAYRAVAEAIEYYSSIFIAQDHLLSVPIGYSLRTRRTVALPLFDDNRNARHALIIGPTGRGKTTLLFYATLLLDMLGGVKCIYIVDPKGDLTEMVKKGGLRKVIVFRSLAGNEAGLVNANTSHRCRGGPSVMVIDEAWRVDRAFLAAVYKLSRSRRVAIIAATQDPWDLGPTIWNNTTTIIVFGSDSGDYLDSVQKALSLPAEARTLLQSLLGSGDFAVKYVWSSRLIEARLPLELVAKLLETSRPAGDGSGSSYGQEADYPAPWQGFAAVP